MLTLLLEALDQTVVSTALPKIVASLQGFDRYTWAVTAYILASTTMIPIVGKLSDQFGRKWFLVVGTAIFLLGSVLAGASQTMNQFIVCEAPASTEPSRKMAVPTTKNHLRPNWSESLPTIGIMVVDARMYAVTAHV